MTDKTLEALKKAAIEISVMSNIYSTTERNKKTPQIFFEAYQRAVHNLNESVREAFPGKIFGGNFKK
ncbi:hypothetical protein [Kosakonia sp. S42]|uniref:hypothetical protein n=1 Tax=Kosakonia sp. S42 TaxID=2767458 RepID=UPI00190D44F6|nr:hypothetical protein [Kosakonia sp. S42]MBK0018734.1 hypothetical protein [Kosakonia sp. S42]